MQKFTIGSNYQQTVSMNIMDRVKSFDDACLVLNLPPSEMTVTGELEKDFASIAAYAKLIIITRALNEGWQPDWTNENEYKYYIWFDLSSGSGLSFNGVYVQFSISYVGSRLCFKSRALAEYAAKQFNAIYTDFFIIKPK